MTAPPYKTANEFIEESESFISSLLAEKDAECQRLDEHKVWLCNRIKELESKLATQRQSVLEEAAHVAEAHIRIRWVGPERREKNLEKVIAKAIRALNNAEEKS